LIDIQSYALDVYFTLNKGAYKFVENLTLKMGCLSLNISIILFKCISSPS